MRERWFALQSASIEVFLALLCILAGLPIVLNPGVFAPASLLALLPLGLVLSWAGFMVIGGFLTVLGVLLLNPYVERSGLICLAAASFVMGVSVIFLVGYTRLFSAGIYLVMSLALYSRYRQLGKLLDARRRKWTRKEQ